MGDFGWDLPPGVTDSMCDGYNPRCSRCGHLADEHYAEDKDLDLYETLPLNAANDFDYMAVEYDANGNRVHGCDRVVGKGINNTQCDCEKFTDEYIEEDYDKYRDE